MGLVALALLGRYISFREQRSWRACHWVHLPFVFGYSFIQFSSYMKACPYLEPMWPEILLPLISHFIFALFVPLSLTIFLIFLECEANEYEKEMLS